MYGIEVCNKRVETKSQEILGANSKNHLGNFSNFRQLYQKNSYKS